MSTALVVNENGVHFADASDAVVHVMLDFPLNTDYIISEALGDNMGPMDDATDYIVKVSDLLAVFDAAAALADSQNRFNADAGLVQAIEHAVAVARR